MTAPVLPRPGEDFAGYGIRRVIGEGRTGVVYEVWHASVTRREAMKVIRPAIAASEALRRGFRERLALVSDIHLPNAVTILDAGEEGGLPWCTMTLAGGATLADELAEYPPRRYAAHEVLGVVHDIARALDVLHGARPPVVHRDIKPGNIAVRRDGTVFVEAVLIDFGTVGETPSGAGAGDRIVGSPAYLAPEVALVGSAVPASDQYSLACTAYEMLRGVRAYPSADLADVPRRRRPASAGRGRAVDVVLRRALARDPAARYPSCGAFADALACALVQP